MSIQEFLIAVFALLIFGLMLPLPSGARMALFMTLIVVGVLTFVGGGTHYLISLVQ